MAWVRLIARSSSLRSIGVCVCVCVCIVTVNSIGDEGAGHFTSLHGPAGGGGKETTAVANAPTASVTSLVLPAQTTEASTAP